MQSSPSPQPPQSEPYRSSPQPRSTHSVGAVGQAEASAAADSKSPPTETPSSHTVSGPAAPVNSSRPISPSVSPSRHASAASALGAVVSAAADPSALNVCASRRSSGQNSPHFSSGLNDAPLRLHSPPVPSSVTVSAQPSSIENVASSDTRQPSSVLCVPATSMLLF